LDVKFISLTHFIKTYVADAMLNLSINLSIYGSVTGMSITATKFMDLAGITRTTI